MNGQRRAFLSLALSAAFAAGGVLTLQPRLARAAGVTQGEVMQLVGTQSTGAGSIDPRIGPLPQLKKPPLSSYNTYKLVDKKTAPVPTGTAVSYPLANGRTLQVTVVEATADKRFRVLTTITDAASHDYLKKLEVLAAPNETFFVAGQNLDTRDASKGALILGITIRS